MSNAFKYTTHGQINLNVVLQNEQLVFEVKDSGIGIAKKHLDLIFKPFSQVNDSINRKSEGVGLGLSISKNGSLFLTPLCVYASPVTKK